MKQISNQKINQKELDDLKNRMELAVNSMHRTLYELDLQLGVHINKETESKSNVVLFDLSSGYITEIDLFSFNHEVMEKFQSMGYSLKKI